MKKLILGAAILAAGMGMSTVSKADCGTVTIADMNWQSAEFIAYVDQFILANGYGCDVELVPGDTMPTGTSMAEKGEPDVAPELWVNALREMLDAQVEQGKLVYAGLSLADGGVEGFWVPQYMVDKHPELATIEGVLKHPELFPNPEDESRGLFMGCPAGWNCQITSGNLYKAFDMDEKGFDLGDPGSAAGLDGSIAKAYERGEGWFGYYWAPTSILGRYPMAKVDFGVPHDPKEWDECTVIPECDDPKPNDWSLSEVYTVTTAGFKDKAPEAYNYVSTRSFSNNFMNKFLKWMDDNQASGEEAAEEFLANYESEWTPWLPKDVADKVKAAL